MLIMKNNKVLSCSTPESKADSLSSKDSDSDAASPVPFLCTQDGTEGETDVIWNFYTPKSEHTSKTQPKNSTPLSRKGKKSVKSKIIDQPLPKRRPIRVSQKKTELFQELIQLNQNLNELIQKKVQNKCLTENQQSGSEDDIFSDSSDYSSKNGLRTSSRCLRKNLLSSKFTKSEPETALESDDSMNECLLKASQAVEDTIKKNEPVQVKNICYEVNNTKTMKSLKQGLDFKMDHDSMDAILNSIKLESPALNITKKCDSPCLNNDSFDSIVGNLNDSVLEQLTQMPINRDTPKQRNKTVEANWTIKELIDHDGSPSSKSFFGRHSSMPESPTVVENKPSTSGMAFGRYNSMPSEKNALKNTGDTPIKCTPDEIKKKHQQAREKLLAKRLLPFTSQQTSQSILPIQENVPLKRSQFQPRVASSNIAKINNKHCISSQKNSAHPMCTDSVDIKILIERKRQEALMKLRRKQPHNKML